MEQLLIEIAKQSPVALVAVIAIWRISLVMMVLVEGFVKVATNASDSLAGMAENNKKADNV